MVYLKIWCKKHDLFKIIIDEYPMSFAKPNLLFNSQHS